jgi:hypothetical protein
MSDTENTPDAVNRLPLRALGLKPGMALQTRRLVAGASKRESQFFGAIEGKGVMVGALGTDTEPSDLTAGDICLVRGFTGQYEYSFPSKVLQTFVQPFTYALLAYPAQVDAKLVRQSMRVKRSWPTRIAVPQPGVQTGDVAVALIDISVRGAMIKADSSLAPVGANLRMTMSVQVDETPQELVLQAIVCHNNRASYEDAYFVGVSFKDLKQQDKLVLSYLTQAS